MKVLCIYCNHYGRRFKGLYKRQLQGNYFSYKYWYCIYLLLMNLVQKMSQKSLLNLYEGGMPEYIRKFITMFITLQNQFHIKYNQEDVVQENLSWVTSLLGNAKQFGRGVVTHKRLIWVPSLFQTRFGSQGWWDGCARQWFLKKGSPVQSHDYIFCLIVIVVIRVKFPNLQQYVTYCCTELIAISNSNSKNITLRTEYPLILPCVFKCIYVFLIPHNVKFLIPYHVLYNALW